MSTTISNTALNIIGVVGKDGIQPVYDPNGRWTMWALHEVFMGPDSDGEGRFVPKVNDWVVDVEASTISRVISVDVTTLKPRLESIRPLSQDQQFDNIDLILGVGPGSIADTFRVYINKSVLPHTLSIDSRLHTYSPDAERFTIFRGSKIDGSAKPVSQLYNAANELIGTSIPLVIASEQGNNRTVKAFPMCNTVENLKNGEKVACIVYSDSSHQVAKVDLLVEETEFVPVADAAVKYITNISLESPFISPSDTTQLRFPVNVPLNGLSLIGVVHYSNGSKIRLPVNNTRFSLRGLDNFISTYAGQTFDLVLDYKLGAGEVVMGEQTTQNGSIARVYKGLTTNYEGMYSPKLYGFPVWLDDVRGYRLEWWLYDMERRMAQWVTPFVKINANSAPFNPIGYGFKQALGVSINLKDVNPSGLALNHVQTIDIVLRQPGGARTTNWAIGFTPQQEPLFGEDNHAKVTIIDQNQMRLDVSCGDATQALWLERLYRLVKPLSDQGREVRAPDPTHFAVATTGWEVSYPISKWNEVLTLTNTVPNNSTLYIKFFIRTPDTDIQLAIAGLPCWHQ